MDEETKEVRTTPTSEDKDAKLVTGVVRHRDTGDESDHDRKEDAHRRDE